MKLNKIDPKFTSKTNPRIGLIALGSDFRIEKDFNNVIHGKNIDLYVNRIHCYNPLTNETLAKMADDITDVTKEILPNEKLDCVAYGCTSGTVAAGYESIKEKINLAKPEANVTTPITSVINALKKLDIKNISVFTPYTESINQSVADYFKKSVKPKNRETLHFSRAGSRGGNIDEAPSKISKALGRGELQRDKLRFKMLEFIDDITTRLAREKCLIQRYKPIYNDLYV